MRKKSGTKWILFFLSFNITILLLMETGLEKADGVVYFLADERLEQERERLLITRRKAKFFRYQETESNRTGPGEGGDEVKLTKEEVALIESQMRKEGFSRYLNSLVSLDRSLDDYRHEVCKNQTYPWDLPTASVIIIYRNELQRVILRTVHSVINRTPPQYLKEVILVDDASDREELQTPLDDHINEHWPDGFVRVIRLPVRSGLIRTRLAGVKAATGDVVIMLDGHMEATKGWIEPLLARIKENNKVLLTSLIDIIHPNNLKYIRTDIVYQTISWMMTFTWTNLPPGTTHDPLKPLPTYALVGCMTVMHRETFLEMGSYDSGMEVWGGENVELPIRIWMCGGRVEIIPCSRVAHTYRAGWGRPWRGSIGDFLDRNAQRTAEVWLDEYKDQFYLMHQHLWSRAQQIRANVTERLELRRRLGCNSFKWFLDNVIKPPMFMYTKNVTAWGQLRHEATQKCFDTLYIGQYHEGSLGIYPCHQAAAMGNTQLFTLTRLGQLRREFHCLSSSYTVPGYNVTLNPHCRDEASQKWTFDKEHKRIVHELSKMCLEATPGVDLIQYVKLNTCKDTPLQRWSWIFHNIDDLFKTNNEQEKKI